jgi:hypothetical protein
MAMQEVLQNAFAMKAGLAMFTAGGRKLGTVAGMP